MLKCGRILTVLGASVLLVSGVAADNYPTKPIRFVIPFPPGGGNDVIGRVVASELGKQLAQQLVVDNRAGAGSVVGTEAVARSAPDGYTLLMASTALAVTPWLFDIKYDPVKAFAPVAPFATGPAVLCVNPSVPARSVAEFVALAKSSPGKYRFAHAGSGAFQHLAGVLFARAAGLDVLPVPFKGGGPAMIAVIGGHSDFILAPLQQVRPQVASGRLRALGVTSAKRLETLPDLPTFDEQGLGGFVAQNWWGVVAPAGTPQTAVAKLNKELQTVLFLPQTLKRFETEGAVAVRMSPVEFGRFIESELAKWGKVIREGSIRADYSG